MCLGQFHSLRRCRVQRPCTWPFRPEFLVLDGCADTSVRGVCADTLRTALRFKMARWARASVQRRCACTRIWSVRGTAVRNPQELRPLPAEERPIKQPHPRPVSEPVRQRGGPVLWSASSHLSILWPKSETSSQNLVSFYWLDQH